MTVSPFKDGWLEFAAEWAKLTRETGVKAALERGDEGSHTRQDSSVPDGWQERGTEHALLAAHINSSQITPPIIARKLVAATTRKHRSAMSM
jgi:hypothetical protein